MDFEKKLAEVKEHFGDLIDEDVAKTLVEYYFGTLKKSENSLSRKAGRSIRVSGIVVDRRVFPGKEYCRVELVSESGREFVYLWDEAYRTAAGEVFPGMRLEVIASAGESGYHVSDAESVRVEVDESAFTPLDALKPSNSVCVRGRIAGIDGVRVTKSGKKIAVFSITDGSAFVPLILWDDKVELAEGMAPGDEVVVFNAYVNEFRGRPSIHAGRNSRVVVNRMEL
ncbi:OB-fold nucleic acid binding domain-containing protein [Geoglobus sp.]